jgi:hypothetical protein
MLSDLHVRLKVWDSVFGYPTSWKVTHYLYIFVSGSKSRTTRLVVCGV